MKLLVCVVAVLGFSTFAQGQGFGFDLGQGSSPLNMNDLNSQMEPLTLTGDDCSPEMAGCLQDLGNFGEVEVIGECPAGSQKVPVIAVTGETGYACLDGLDQE